MKPLKHLLFLPIVAVMLMASPCKAQQVKETRSDKNSVRNASAAPTERGAAGADEDAAPSRRGVNGEAGEAGESHEVVLVPLVDGEVDGNLLFQSVGKDLHWIGGTVVAFSQMLGASANSDEMIPAARVDNLVDSFPKVFTYETDPKTGQPVLAVDRTELASSLADKKGQFRKWLAGVEKLSISKLEKVDSTWSGAARDVSPPRIVVTLAGLHGVASSASEMAVALHERTNLPGCVFEYPNDAPIFESAGYLARSLEALHREYPRSRITLVTHSMGGLVARCALEVDSTRPNGVTTTLAGRTGVDQLIQVCPPNHGSALAQYGPLLEGFEQLYRLTNRVRGEKARPLVRMIADGFNEASADIANDSHFLRKLNGQTRAPEVRYTILAGDDGPLRRRATNLLSEVWRSIASAVDEPESVNKRITDLIGCDELKKGKGDGVVTIESARLESVADFEVLGMHHLTWGQLDTPAGKELLSAIVRRLGVSL